MLFAKLLSIVVAALSCAVMVAPAFADEFTDSLASIRRAMVGHWSGEVSGTDASGEKFEADDAFTFVVTSEDGLDSATWGAETLEIQSARGGPVRETPGCAGHLEPRREHSGFLGPLSWSC